MGTEENPGFSLEEDTKPIGHSVTWDFGHLSEKLMESRKNFVSHSGDTIS